MYGVRLLGVRRLMLSMAKMARVDVGLDDAQPNLRASDPTCHNTAPAQNWSRQDRVFVKFGGQVGLTETVANINQVVLF